MKKKKIVWGMLGAGLMSAVFLTLSGSAPKQGILDGDKDVKEDIKGREEWFNRPRRIGLNGKSPAELLLKARRQAKNMTGSNGTSILSRPKTSSGAPVPAGLSGNWNPVGPQPLNCFICSPTGSSKIVYSGRGTAIAIDPVSNAVYYGSADGGVWKSTDALQGPGAHFVPVSDQTDSLSVGTIALDTSAERTGGQPVVYVGTGEANGSSSYYGIGILRSPDGGQTWNTPVTEAKDSNGNTITLFGTSFSKILVDPDNPQTVAAGAVYGGFTNAGQPQQINSVQTYSGFFYSYDGGQTWTQSIRNPVSDIVWDSQRHVFVAALPGAGFVSSPDGAKWTNLGSPFLNGVQVTRTNFGRASLAERNGTLYAVIATTDGTSLSTPSSGDTGIVQSTNGGVNWTPIAAPDSSVAYLGQQPWYNQFSYNQYIAAPPGTQSLVVAGIFPLRTDTLSGATTAWKQIVSLHADQHAIAFADSTHWFGACDGGLDYTANSGDGWTEMNDTLNTLQFYSVSPDSQVNGGFIGGSQDNGNGSTTSNNLMWNQTGGGDGFYTAADPNQQGVYYGLDADNGGLYQYSSTAQVNTVVTNMGWQPFEVLPGSGPTSLVTAPSDVEIGPAQVSGPGAGWHGISQTQTFPSAVKYLAPAPQSADVIYLTSGSSIYVTRNATSSQPTWTALNPTGSFGFSLGHLVVSPASLNTVFVIVEGFNDGEKIFMTTDAQDTQPQWTNITGNLPNAPFNWITIDSQNSGNVYAASDVGVFEITDGGINGQLENWQMVGTGLPDSVVLQVKISNTYPRQLVAATFGRGAWTLGITGTTPPTPVATAIASPPCVPSGAEWVQATPQAAFAARADFGSVVFNNQMWIVGGRTGMTASTAADNRDTWYSNNGKTWQLGNPAPAFQPREEFTLLNFDPGDGNQRIWMIGGFTPFSNPPNQIFNDVWVSPNGSDWRQVTANTNFPTRLAPACFVFNPATGSNLNGRMWVMAGGGFDDVWSSSDGVSWVQNTAHVPGMAQGVSNAVVMSGKVYAISQSGLNQGTNHVWSSTDGANWTPVTPDTGFPRRDNFAFFALGGKLFVIGGSLGTARFNDVWSSTDGKTWNQETPASGIIPFAPRGLYQGGLAFQNQLWVIGGVGVSPNGGPSTFFNDVWNTICGTGTGMIIINPGLLQEIINQLTHLIGLRIGLTNQTEVAIDLSQVEVRYWFNSDCAGHPIISAQLEDGDRERRGRRGDQDDRIRTSSGTLSPGSPIHYLSLKFRDGSLPAGQSLIVDAAADFSRDLFNRCGISALPDGSNLTIYVNGQLVSGQEPRDVPTATRSPTASPTVPGFATPTPTCPFTLAAVANCYPTATATSAPGILSAPNRVDGEATVTATPMATATFTTVTGEGVLALPNISQGGQPIRFGVELEKPAHIGLTLYSITGEVVYQMDSEGATGLKLLLWRLNNQGGQAVASGLYIYVIRVDDGTGPRLYKGRVAVIH